MVNVLNHGKVAEFELAEAIVTCCFLNFMDEIVFNALIHLAKLRGEPSVAAEWIAKFYQPPDLGKCEPLLMLTKPSFLSSE